MKRVAMGVRNCHPRCTMGLRGSLYTCKLIYTCRPGSRVTPGHCGQVAQCTPGPAYLVIQETRAQTNVWLFLRIRKKKKSSV